MGDENSECLVVISNLCLVQLSSILQSSTLSYRLVSSPHLQHSPLHSIPFLSFPSPLTVPDGGYGEDEDCLNAEDEEYRSVLERMESDGKYRHESE